MKALDKLEPHAYALLRVVAGAMFAFHGVQKVFGWLGRTQAVGSQLWIGGVIELVGGVLIAIGLFTRWAALVASGTMAVAYFQFHWKLDLADYRWLPAINKGELAALYCFVFLLIALRGPGMCSVDRTRG
jgi:putative oxidoreductase